MPYCTDCKFKLSLIVSNRKAPNEYRISTYSCKKCSRAKGYTVIVAITRKKVDEDDLWNVIGVDIFETPKI